MAKNRKKTRSRCKAIMVGDLSKGSYLIVCVICGQEFVVGSGTPRERIAKAHQEIKKIDHDLERGHGLV